MDERKRNVDYKGEIRKHTFSQLLLSPPLRFPLPTLPEYVDSRLTASINFCEDWSLYLWFGPLEGTIKIRFIDLLLKFVGSVFKNWQNKHQLHAAPIRGSRK